MLKKLICIIVFIITSLSVFGQKGEKEVYYFNEKGDLIPKNEFKNKVDYNTNCPVYFENDTISIAKLVKRSVYGRLNVAEKRQLLKLLEKTIDKKIDSSKTIIINYFFKEDSCIGHYSTDEEYLIDLKKNENILQLFMTSKGYFYSSKNVKIYNDSHDIFRQFFFKYEFSCGNYLIIKPDGSYYIYYGEYYQPAIIEKALSDWKGFDKTLLMGKWRLIGEYNKNGKQMNRLLENPSNAKNKYYLELKINNLYLRDLATGSNLYKEKTSHGIWNYNIQNHSIIFEKYLNKHFLKIVPKKYTQKKNDGIYLTPVEYKILEIKENSLVLFEKSHSATYKYIR